MSEKLERLNIALDAAGVPIRGRGKALVDKTGYSSGMISRFLSGKDVLNDRFTRTVCREFGISHAFIQSGEGDILGKGVSIKSEMYDNQIFQKIHDGIVDFLFPSIVDMSESALYRLYADFLECDSIRLVKKNGEMVTLYAAPYSDLVNK